MNDFVQPQEANPDYETEEPILYESDGPVAWITDRKSVV